MPLPAWEVRSCRPGEEFIRYLCIAGAIFHVGELEVNVVGPIRIGAITWFPASSDFSNRLACLALPKEKLPVVDWETIAELPETVWAVSAHFNARAYQEWSEFRIRRGQRSLPVLHTVVVDEPYTAYPTIWNHRNTQRTPVYCQWEPYARN